MGHLRNQRNVRVDPHAAEVEALGHPHGATEVFRPHTAGQRVVNAVGPTHCFVLVAELLDGDDWAEDLVLNHLVVLAQVGDDRRLEEEAVTTNGTAAGNHVRVRRSPTHEAADVGQLIRVVDWAVEHFFVVGVAGTSALGLLRQCGDQILVDARRGDDSRCGRAVLAGIEVAGDGNAFGCSRDVGVVEHHDGRLATELEVHPLQTVRGALGNLHAGAHRAGDADHRRRVVQHHLATGIAVSADHVEHTGRKELGRDLGQQAGGRGRRVAGLQDDGVPGGDGRRKLPDRHHHRVVPRSYLGTDTNGLATNDRGHVAHVLACALAFEMAGGSGKEANLVDHRRNLFAAHEVSWLAAVLNFQADQFFSARLYGIGDAKERQRALTRGRLTPALVGSGGRTHGCVDIGLCRKRRGCIHLAGDRVDQTGGAAIGRLDVLTIDEVLERLHADRILLCRSASMRSDAMVASQMRSERRTNSAMMAS